MDEKQKQTENQNQPAVAGAVVGQDQDVQGKPESVFEYAESKFLKIFKYSFYTVFTVAFVWIGFNLFFQQPASFFLGLMKQGIGVVTGSVTSESGGAGSGWFGSSDGTTLSKMPSLRVLYPYEETSFEPTKMDPIVSDRLLNTYDTLVRPDNDLRMRPDLALSWGVINDDTWEFNLRPNVVFQDGSTFSAQDVVASVNRAKEYKDSDLKDIFKNIEKVDVVDDLTIRILTKVPDPMLLSELSSLFIIPSEYEKKTIATPVGTGPYEFEKISPMDNIVLKRFDKYWGDKPKFETVTMYGRSDISVRGNMMLKGDVDLLTFVPYDALKVFQERGVVLTSVPTLQIEFLLFNEKSKVLTKAENRNAIRLAIDTNALVDAINGAVSSINQYASNGVFGYNPKISTVKYDVDISKKMISDLGLNGATLTMILPDKMQFIGDYVRKNLASVGVNLLVSYYPDYQKFLEAVDSGVADLYFFGYQSNFGDANDFMKDMAYSKGDYNYGKYSNLAVDQMISSASTEMDLLKRRIFLQDAMKILVEDDPIGVPLIEHDVFYSFSEKINYEPRIDQKLYFDDVNIK